MSFAENFLEQLREGKTTEAIATLKESMKGKTDSLINESREELLQSYGFAIKEAKEDDDKENDKKDKTDDDDKEGDDKDKDEE